MDDISRIPDEILGEIFLQLRPYRANIQRFHAFLGITRERLHYPRPCYQKRYPWVLTHVCRRWRHIAQATPRLWTYLPAIDLSGKSDQSHSLDHFLHHAKYSPLSLFFWRDDNTDDGVIFSKLVKHVQQWRGVTFFFPDEDLPLSHLVKGQFKTLRKATIVCRWSAPIPIDLFADAPVLEELEWLIELELFPILPPSLTRFYGFWPGPLAALALLSSAPNLVECKFEGTLNGSGWSGYVLPNLPLTMPHLTALILQDCGGSVNENNEDVFLGSLVLPKLRHLDFWLTINPGVDFRYEDIIKLLDRSHAPLRSFALQFHFRTFPTSDQLKGILELLPELEYCRLYTFGPTSIEPERPLLSILLDPGLVPKLSTLIWDSQNFEPLPGNVVTDIVRLRSKNRYGVDKEDSIGDGHPRSLAYFSLSRPEVGPEVQDALLGWSQAEDPHYHSLVEVSKQLQEHFTLPVFLRGPEVVADINRHIEWIIANHESFHILAVLTSDIHMVLFKLVIRGQSDGRVECNWIPQISTIVGKWQSDTKQHLQKSCWFVSEELYWVTDGQHDAYDLFWQLGPPIPYRFNTARRSIPVEWIHRTLPENWVPDWEHAELPRTSYEPGITG